MGDPYSFVKGGDFFGPCGGWPTLNTVLGHDWDEKKLTLTLKLQRPDQPDGEPCLMQLLLLQQNLFRVRINPKHLREDDFTRTNTRTIVQDSFDDLRRILEDRLPFTVKFVPEAAQLVLTTHSQITESLSRSCSSETRPTLRIIVDLAPLQITVFDCSAPADAPPVWRTARPGIRYIANGGDDFCIIQAVEKPPEVRYVGFGEQGGTALFKQSAQLVYFNYDNMRYRQVSATIGIVSAAVCLRGLYVGLMPGQVSCATAASLHHPDWGFASQLCVRQCSLLNGSNPAQEALVSTVKHRASQWLASS